MLVVLAVWVAVGTAATFWIPMPDRPGFADVEAYRAVFLHVPLAWTGCLAFVVAAWHGGAYLKGRRLISDARAYGSAEAGMVLLALGTVTGMVFAKSQWGTWWHWDPRQTSVFIVMLIYAAYLLLRGALPPDERLRAQLSAAFLLLAVVPMLWLIGYYPRVAQGTLHPQAQQAPFDPPHWNLMFFNFAGFVGVYAVLMRLHNGIGRLRLAGWEDQR